MTIEPSSFCKKNQLYTRMECKSDNLRNLDFQAESPQTMPHNYYSDSFLYYNDHDFNILLMLKFQLA